MFAALEQARLDTDCRGYLVHLEQVGILSPTQRELVIDRLMALDGDEIDIEKLKWVVLMVLFSQPGQETAFSRMEDLVFEDRSGATRPSLAEAPQDAAPADRCRGPPRHVFLRDMTKNLVIVESPAKAKTIKKYLGKDFEVMASYGHVRDLVPKEGAVDPDA